MSPDEVDLVFLGTGASGGTPGEGRSLRRESSLLVRGEYSLLIDATRHFPDQSALIGHVDLVLLTHGHRDASGGIGALRRWVTQQEMSPPPVLAHPETIRALRGRYARLDPIDLIPVNPGERSDWLGWTITAVEVPHASDPRRFPTFAWRIEQAGKSLVYASDVARLTSDLAQLSAGASVLVLDGAIWGREMFTHLRADRALHEVCSWPVDRILLTQIGRSAPPHEALIRRVADCCRRARPAWDGMVERL